MKSKNIYFEKCNCSIMVSTNKFVEKLKRVQKLVGEIDVPNKNKLLKNRCGDNICERCVSDRYHKLGNIVWNSNIAHKIEHHNQYPSEYFIKILSNIVVFDNFIINPPIHILRSQTTSFNYIKLDHNKLLIIDALVNQGSYPQYILNNKGKKKLIFSEHSGAISVSNKKIDNIIISAETDRIDPNDSKIFLPKNTSILSNYMYIFHTHPNTINYAGRIKDNIIYEFPSANDIFNFIKYYNEAVVQVSIVVAPEGLYAIRPVDINLPILDNFSNFEILKTFIGNIELTASNRFKYIKNLSDPDVFHKNVAQELKYIKILNSFLKKMNI